jgi:hypothetical protein
MKTILLALTLGCAGLLPADPAITEGMSNGRAWKGLGGGDSKMAVSLRFIYLVGLADGFRKAQGEIAPEEEKAREIAPNLLPAGSGFPIMIAALDEFYSDIQNLDIPIPMAARHEKAKLEGRDPKQLAENLKRLRILYKISKELDSLK